MAVVVDPCTGLWGVNVGILRIAEAYSIRNETRRTVFLCCDVGAIFANGRGQGDRTNLMIGRV